MSASIPLAISPCPNDTFGFFAAITSKIPSQYRFRTLFHDIETLNEMALAGFPGIIKVSAAIYARVSEHYDILPFGAAFGTKGGPLLVSNKEMIDLPNMTVAIPGIHTSAFQALQMLFGTPQQLIQAPYFEIPKMVATKNVDAGLIIHESRFMLDKSIRTVIDLGKLYKKACGYALPLGIVLIQKKLHTPELENMLYCSFQYAQGMLCQKEFTQKGFGHKQKFESDAFAFAQRFAQQKKPSIIKQHIQTFMTKESFSLSTNCKEALLQFGAYR